jgi:phage head maturation protease
MSAVGDALPAPAAIERTIEGQVVPYGQWLEVDNPREGHFLERFAPGSLRTSFGFLRRLKGYFDHGRSRTFDRAPVMQITETWETGAGAFFRAALLDGIPSYIVDGIRRGLYGASLGAEPVDVDVDRFPERSAHNPKRLEERTYREVKAFDISLTASPAYESATVALRAKDCLGSEPDAILRVALEPVHFLASPSARHNYVPAPSRRHDFIPARDYLAEEDWRV